MTTRAYDQTGEPKAEVGGLSGSDAGGKVSGLLFEFYFYENMSALNPNPYPPKLITDARGRAAIR